MAAVLVDDDNGGRLWWAVEVQVADQVADQAEPARAAAPFIRL